MGTRGTPHGDATGGAEEPGGGSDGADDGWSVERWVTRRLTPSRQRFVGQLATARTDVEAFGKRLDAVGADTFRLDAARRLLDDAERALDGNDAITFRQCYNEAQRWLLLAGYQIETLYRQAESGGVGAIDDVAGVRSAAADGGRTGLTDASDAPGIRPMHITAWRIRAEAADTLSGWRKRAVQRLLPGADELLDPETDTPVAVDELLAASRILHEHAIDREVARQTLFRQFRYFIGAAIVAVAAVLPALWFMGRTAGGGDPLADAVLTDPAFPGVIVLFGVLGASVSGIVSIARALGGDAVPDEFDSRRLAVARFVMGGGAALALFVFLQSGLFTIGEETTTAIVLAVAFAGGFSERLLVRAVRAITGDEGDDVEAWGGRESPRSRPSPPSGGPGADSTNRDRAGGATAGAAPEEPRDGPAEDQSDRDDAGGGTERNG